MHLQNTKLQNYATRPPTANRQPPTPMPDAETFEDEYCTQVELTDLEGDNKLCSICVVPYGDPSPDEDGRTDNSIQFNFGTCHHIFGHRCLRQLIDCQEAWNNKCPLCRTHWFRTFKDIEAEELAEILFEMQESEEWNSSDEELMQVVDSEGEAPHRPLNMVQL
jgi:hypothetical protein